MKKIIILAAAALAMVACAEKTEKSARWTPEQAQAWYDEQGWLVGCDYIPADAINQIASGDC